MGENRDSTLGTGSDMMAGITKSRAEGTMRTLYSTASNSSITSTRRGSTLHQGLETDEQPDIETQLNTFDAKPHIRIRVPQRLELAVHREAGSYKARQAAVACEPGKPAAAYRAVAAVRHRMAAAALPPAPGAQDLDLVAVAAFVQWLAPPLAR
ncbi:hypothetical protein GOZ78_04135 [Agrobacterium vitis]|uniref:Uncharacterized protein n=1 Tax=Agrobacterium vitis TaxID=373 RepID=A0ABD6GGD9_AGRVI|nr:hypothetical protein [Agrobacterium vitis]MUO97018.1 hypothetical protein [Agrobacterium vitis]MUP08117.1 hypothetical protein [Agrobacterium vitis]MUZ80655.1 hypothetical protein [Agrobacterium vitis]MVA09209.1 hypothetical protein [Agrobacterium vitis]MVA93264.1 hypothetical protein [Agrobacterium vitis]